MIKLLITVSGGRSSGYKAKKLFDEYGHLYDMRFVFANTGQEHEKTLEFVKKMTDVWGLPVDWIEAVVHHDMLKGSTHKYITFETASRKGEPFIEVIKKYGLPTTGYLHCTRELKINPMNSYMKEHGLTHRTLGIRYDEEARYHPKEGVLYPLYDWRMTKERVNRWWLEQPFDLEIPDYLGNCTWCYKKGPRKINLLAIEHPEVFDFPLRMETEYPDETRKIFRGWRTTREVLDNPSCGLFDDVDECAEECGSVMV